MTAVLSNLNFKKREMSDSQRYTENLYLINNVEEIFAFWLEQCLLFLKQKCASHFFRETKKKSR